MEYRTDVSMNIRMYAVNSWYTVHHPIIRARAEHYTQVVVSIREAAQER